MKKSTANMNNIILILTSGGDTPTYDEENASRASTPQPDSAEEGECNDDGVELKPSLRIKNLIDSPER